MTISAMAQPANPFSGSGSARTVATGLGALMGVGGGGGVMSCAQSSNFPFCDVHQFILRSAPK